MFRSGHQGEKLVVATDKEDKQINLAKRIVS